MLEFSDLLSLSSQSQFFYFSFLLFNPTNPNFCHCSSLVQAILATSSDGEATTVFFKLRSPHLHPETTPNGTGNRLRQFASRGELVVSPPIWPFRSTTGLLQLRPTSSSLRLARTTPQAASEPLGLKTRDPRAASFLMLRRGATAKLPFVSADPLEPIMS